MGVLGKTGNVDTHCVSFKTFHCVGSPDLPQQTLLPLVVVLTVWKIPVSEKFLSNLKESVGLILGKTSGMIPSITLTNQNSTISKYKMINTYKTSLRCFTWVPGVPSV